MADQELLVYNGRIYLRPEVSSRVQAILVKNGRVERVGSEKEILKLRSSSTETLDLRGRSAVPGLADSHIHLLGYGAMMCTLDLSSARSIIDIQKMLAKAASNKQRDDWIVGRGWDQEKLRERRYPERSDIDILANPVFLRRICGHVAVANSAALSRAGVDENTLGPFGGKIEREPSGRPDGILKERALDIVTRAIPKNEGEARRSLLLAARKLLEYGVTTLHCIIEDEQEFRILRELKKEGKIEQTIYAILPLNMLDGTSSSGTLIGTSVDGFRTGGLKVFLDGSLGARTAALGNPYDDEPGSSGLLTTSKDRLSDLIKKARELGLQLCLHAIGDKAVEMAVNTLESSIEARECRTARHRIEHASLLSPELIRGMARLGLVGSVQPRFVYSDSWAEKRLGGRIRNLYAFKSLLRAGVHLAAGSDSPSDEPRAVEGLWSAVARPGLFADERLTAGEALSCYTTGAAYASFSEADEGTLEIGKCANVTIFDIDPFECAPEDLRRLRVVQTVVRGKVFRWN